MSRSAPVSTASRLAPAIADGIAHEMRADPTTVVWGEDVSIGVMGPTRGLHGEFGDRVRDMPIAEGGFLGAAIGAAIGGLRPIVDLMFLSFAYVAWDQLVNQAARARYMTGGQVTVPLVAIAAAGAAGSNAAQHSEASYAMLLHAGGLRVAFPSTVHQAFWLTREAIRSDDPVVLLHHPALTSRRGQVNSTPLRLGEADVGPVGDDVSIIATGLMADRSRASAKTLAEEGLSVEVVDLCSLSPMPWDSILKSVAKTGRAVVVDEARLTCSVASDVAARVSEELHGMLKVPVRRLAVPDVPIPFAPNLERAVIPSEAAIVDAVREVSRA